MNQISVRDIEQFKAGRLGRVAPSTLNNILSCLRRCLSYAEENEIIESVPRIRNVKACKPDFDVLDFDEYGRLVSAASRDVEELAAVLLGGDAGLRVGEIRALQWGDIDLPARQVTVQRTDYRGYTGSPKGGRIRRVPLTKRLASALKSHRHLRGEWVFCLGDGRMLNRGHADTLLRRPRKRAGLRKFGWHTLRHTFCSHLAMKNAPVRSIQALAGHASITTTMRYMHLTTSAEKDAIALLEEGSLQHDCNASRS